MSDGAFPDRLTQLKSRWESDPSSRVFLQLAEEFRHQGRVKEALSVLDRGLKEHPGYLSALVAKGRCHLELGEPEPARTVLERVVKQDATQMVANKLLVRAYLDTGEPEKARERLELYSLLNDSDPEIEELRRRLRAMEQPLQAPPTSDRPSAAAPPLPAPPAAGRPGAAGADIFDLGFTVPAVPAAARVQDEPFADLWAPPASVSAPAAPSPGKPPEPDEEVEPAGTLFPGLASRESRQRYFQALAAEGIFFLDPPAGRPAAAEPLAVTPTPAASPAAPLPEISPEILEPERRVPAAPAEADAFDLEERTPWAAEAAPVKPEPAAAEPAPEPVATATLGDLYLRQGHRDEAERIFREVLRREPDNSAAQLGLARLVPEPAPLPTAPPAPSAPAAPPTESRTERREGRPLEARDLLVGYAAAEGSEPTRARQVFLLNSYLKRLRRGGQRDVS
jgi:tetratricopeptide (TPR) repeat protein